MDNKRFRTLKHARNRYDYLTRKLNSGKNFTYRDEEDYYVLYEIFEKEASEIQTNSDNFQTNSDAFSNVNPHKTSLSENSDV